MTARIPDQKDDHQLLYHVKRTINDFSQDLSGATQTTDILNTFTNLDAAKSAALTSLFSQGYLKDDFIKYEENDRTQELKHGDGVMVFAKGPSGREFYIGLDTTPNVFFFQGNAFGEVEGPLYYGRYISFFAIEGRGLTGLQSSKPRYTITMIALVASKKPKLEACTLPGRRPKNLEKIF